ncbi:MAG TPA: PocR ligand-binding domain-containing protein, partial [Spirochaetia bacterium]
MQATETQKIRRLAADYRASTGLPLLLVDVDGRASWRLGDCTLCGRFAGPRRREALCRGHCRRSIEESFRWGEPFISLCPFGLVTFAVPLSRDRGLCGGLLSGFSIFPQMASDMREEVLENARRLGLPASAPRPRMHFREVSTEGVRRNARLLFELTAAYGMNDVEQIEESHARSVQQFSIANYLEEAREGRKDLITSLASMENEII